MPATPVEFILMFSTGVVAFALLLSGTSKVSRSDRTLQNMADLGVPRVMRHRWVAVCLPFWELALGVALLVAPGWLRASAAAVAAATFAVFTLVLIGVLRRGEEVDCGCFGALSSDDRVTRWTVGRNLLLIALAGATAFTAAGHQSFVMSVASSDMPTVLACALAWCLLAIVTLMLGVLKLRRRVGSLSSSAADTAAGPRPDGGDATAPAFEGAPIPDVEVVSADGITRSLRVLGAGNPVLVVFLSAECGKCAHVARRLPDWAREIGPSVLLRVVTSSRPDVLRERMPEVLPYAFFGAGEARRALGIAGIPSAVLLGGSQYPFVASPIANREDEIDDLVRGVVDAQERASR